MGSRALRRPLPARVVGAGKVARGDRDRPVDTGGKVARGARFPTVDGAHVGPIPDASVPLPRGRCSSPYGRGLTETATSMRVVITRVHPPARASTAVGGLSGGIFNTIAGKSFFDGFEEGAFSGAISGAIAGGLCSWLSGAGEIALSIPKQMLVGGFGDVGASIINDFGDIIINV